MNGKERNGKEWNGSNYHFWSHRTCSSSSSSTPSGATPAEVKQVKQVKRVAQSLPLGSAEKRNQLACPCDLDFCQRIISSGHTNDMLTWTTLHDSLPALYLLTWTITISFRIGRVFDRSSDYAERQLGSLGSSDAPAFRLADILRIKGDDRSGESSSGT